MSQKDLAEQAGLTTRLISEIANNKMKMYPKDALEKIMVALDVKNLGDLLQHIDEETDN
ncbi:helix-turn-helix transcriptional regulator [Lysinibacillus pakistanensis]|uniref:helix-turn-helix domain-containing protein n=1 Tax=Lysinibacillus pakistanensis TaxID=759811 RepID=UPI003D2703AF